jgi:hypothetical protein
MKINLTVIIILVILLSFFIYYFYNSQANKEGLRNKHGYITKLRKYNNSNIKRPFRKKKERMTENINNIRNKITKRINNFLF